MLAFTFILFNKSLNGINIIKAINIFTEKSPRARVIQGTPVLKKAMKKNIKVSKKDPNKEDINGATNHIFSLNLSNTCTSIS